MKHFSLSKAVFMAASLALLGLTAANAQENFPQLSSFTAVPADLI